MSTELAVITPEIIKAKFNIALTEAGFQKVQDKVNALVINEDNVQVISDTINEVKALVKVIEKKHEEGKKPYWEAGKLWDVAKNDFLRVINGIVDPVNVKYTALCKEIQRKQEIQDKENARIAKIKKGIEDNTLSFSSQIAGCITIKDLLSIERLINLEKTRKDKYSEFITEAEERFNSLNEAVKLQKDSIKELEALKNVDINDDAAVLAAEDKKEAITARIEENKVVVQQDAVNSFTKISSNYIPIAHTIYPPVKARRTTWEIELVDTKEALKKAPSLLTISLNKDAARLVYNALKDSGAIAKDAKEYTLNGIRYYERQLF